MLVYLCASLATAKNNQLIGSALTIYYWLFGKYINAGRILDKETGLILYSDVKINRVSNIIATVLTLTLPVITIFVLNVLLNTNLRVRLIVLFTAIFALVLVTFTSARQVKIFTTIAT